jgi:hypothetical protein
MAGKKFKINYRGVDGKSVKSFSTLEEAGKYLADRYQGADYLLGSNVMGTDYAQYELTGFSLSDVGQFDFSQGYKDFEFYDWAGGTLRHIRRFTVVQRGDCVGDGQVVVASYDTLEEAITEAIKLCSEDLQFNIEDNGTDIGYAVDKQWIENVPFEQVALAEWSPPF